MSQLNITILAYGIYENLVGKTIIYNYIQKKYQYHCNFH